jgi:hypothetical protein
MAFEPTKHVNGRMWPPCVSCNPNGRPVGSRTAFSHGFLKDLAEVGGSMAAIPCCTRLRPTGHVLRSSERMRDLSAANFMLRRSRRNRSKITGRQHF